MLVGGEGDADTTLRERLSNAQADIEKNVQRLNETRWRLSETRAEIQAGRDQRQILHDSAYARLSARLESLPVIEQAKGVLIAQTGCEPDEAFSLLRAASQRANVKVRDLAVAIVQRASAGGAKPEA